MNNTQAYQLGYTIGEWIIGGAVIALVIWAVWAIVHYKPFSHFIQVAYDFRKFVIQVVSMYGNKPSFFSIKRFHNGLITYWALITASLFIRHNKLSAAELMMIITPFLSKAVYDVYQTQQDKKLKVSGDLNEKIVDNATDVANKIVEKDDSKI